MGDARCAMGRRGRASVDDLTTMARSIGLLSAGFRTSEDLAGAEDSVAGGVVDGSA